MWLTDPALAIGPDGTLYLSALRSNAQADCTATQSEENTVDLWFAPPPPAGQSPTLQPFITADGSGTPLAYPDLVVLPPNPATVFPVNNIDHPKVAVSASGAVVVTWVDAEQGGVGDVAEVVSRNQITGAK